MSTLEVRGLTVSVGGREIIRDLDLTVESGSVHVIMGRNGSGKSTLAHALAGRPGYTITRGTVSIDGVDLTTYPPADRARAGLFLALQQPLEVPGVLPVDVLVAAGARRDTVRTAVAAEAARIGLDGALLERFVNVDLSGGERKRAEIVQLGVLRPKFAMLDEVDSGLDVDALRLVAHRLVAASQEWGCGVIAITHFRRLLDVLTPTRVHVMRDGRLERSGGPELVDELEAHGYGDVIESDA